MALFRWTGATSTAWNTDSNWQDGGGTPYGAGRYPGSVASTYDDVLFDTAVTNSVAGYDAPGAGDEVLASFRIAPAYDGSIGTWAGTVHLDIEVSHDSDDQMPDSVVNIDAENADFILLDGGGTYGLRRVNVTASAGGLLNFKGKIGSAHFQKATGIVLSDIAPACVISDSLNVGYITNPTSDVTLVIEAGVTLPSTITVTGGTITNNVGITTLYLSGGSWAQNAGDITNLYQYGTASFTWNAGNIDYAEIHGGSLNARNDSSVGRDFEVIKVYQNGTLDLQNDIANNTVTQGGYIQVFGGTLEFNYGQKLLPIP